MPKKHYKHAYGKPVNTVHPSLTSSGRHEQNSNGARPAAASSSTGQDQASVNELISHLRRTQVSRFGSEDGATNLPRYVAPRSVHPSLRNLLELPETPPPRPRPNSRRTVVIGGRPIRRTPGPPPPESWLLSSDVNGLNDNEIYPTEGVRDVIYRLDRLPGATFPRQDGLLHTTLKSMATNWAWHVEYDGTFLSQLPSQIKVLLLSYIGMYARNHQPLNGLMRGLHPLFVMTSLDHSEGDNSGRLMTFRQFVNELVVSGKPGTQITPGKPENTVPSSWDEEESESGTGNVNGPPSSVPSVPPTPLKPLDPGLRFENLRFLSLAHPHPAAASWKSLLNLLPHLSRITHLSLAHWPVPTMTPHAKNARVRHPAHRSLTFSYSGTDSYSALENNWIEAATVLRKLSRSTYCLKWLDLEGCGDWYAALSWDGNNEAYSTPTGPEWNGSWRNVEWLGLGPGWVPSSSSTSTMIPDPERRSQSPPPLLRGNRTLASSIHAPASAPSASSPDDHLPWDVEEERVKYRQGKAEERFREIVTTAKTVEKRLLQTRREGRGKWLHVSYGLDGVDEHLLRRVLGGDYYKYM
ncbi:hypothetical protein ASPZODRAFT_1933471 [Penicilliopsis zonata CBS 506.65]|uniref:Tafazzin n=1 Tax=Penicilliopsis zonata CBS 506.65 TaxID=1073090 RepID=A0A1L9SJE4_9EURO|nr:hypothetical protein ASPZODRAFT_1933471 [Penicilliopsis zonata CBS 506.65]OJJ47275.1 hypothetical protein ASPZODRAFT_1933471 [Penicilliopsis zonata CBS 506.65]